MDEDTLNAAVHMTVGELVDPLFSNQLRIGPGTVRDVLADLSDRTGEEVEERVKDTGDLSEVAAELTNGADRISVKDLWGRVNRTVKRNEDRAQLVRYVYKHTAPIGVKYFIRMALSQMRIGVGHSMVVQAIAGLYGVDAEAVRRLYALTNDIGLAAVRARRGSRSLAQSRLSLFRPYRFMNARRVDNLDEAFRRLEGERILFETKYDGARLQIHIGDGGSPEIRLFSRKLDDVTQSLPDVKEALQNCWTGGQAIVEGEAVAFDSSLKVKQPIQGVLSRLGRRHDIEARAEEIPLVVFLFDILLHDSEDLMGTPQRERRNLLRDSFRSTRRIRLTDGFISKDRQEVESFFADTVEAGHEGLIAKDPEGVYEPGSRLHTWMKVKPESESLDVVVVGGIWGSGRKKGLLSSLIVAVRDTDDLLTIGKVGTGFSDETLESLTEQLEKNVIASQGRRVDIEPSIVIEVDFQGTQKTAAYGSGYALRIPRFKRLRSDKSVCEADTLERLEELHEKQA